jgi:tRNA 5-methylaminomethyl-2-thiouridine biosynthesis bifunctional protein
VALRQWNLGASGTLQFEALEKYPLTKAHLERALLPWTHLKEEVESLLRVYPEEKNPRGVHRLQISPTVTLVLVFEDVLDAIPQMSFDMDVWFLDGFGPKKNPDMWTPAVFELVAAHSKPQTTLVTFTSAGHVRRGLEAVGFAMERRKGFGPKWESLFGTKL